MSGCKEEATVMAVAQYEVLKDLRNEIADNHCQYCKETICNIGCKAWNILKLIDEKLGYPYDCQWK